VDLPGPLLRAGAALYTTAGWFGVGAGTLTPEVLLDAARAKMGLDDFGVWAYPDALEVACRSLQDDAQLSPVGRFVLHTHLVHALSMRLALVEAEKRSPEVFQAPLRTPIIILGLPRTGTTLLHRLLSEAEGARGVPTWEIRSPIHLGGSDRRRRDAGAAIAALRALAPGLDAKHLLHADEPEECVGLFDPSLWTPSLWRFGEVYGYQDWYFDQDPEGAYRLYRKMLQWLQAQQPDRRLVLKLPNHTAFVDTLQRVIPEAVLLQTHREPEVVLASYCSLMSSIHQVGAATRDPQRAGRASLDLWATHLERCMAARASGEDRVVDVPYSKLTADPVGTVVSIHEHAGLPIPESQRSRWTEAVQGRKQHRYGRHRYRLAAHGLDEAMVRERFASIDTPAT